MKWLLVLFVCITLKQVVFAQPNPGNTNTPTTLLKPKRPVICLSIDTNVRDYAPNYDSLINTFASLSYRENPALRRLREHNSNVQRVFSLDNIRRFLRYNTQNPNLTADEKNKQKTTVNEALNNYKTATATFLTEINTLATSIDPTTTMQECQQTAQSAAIASIGDANALTAYSKEMCENLNNVIAIFETALEGAYSKVGAKAP
ncbi:uncharacterized protein LOC116345823 [Contarinia nasturtii]|uniref:uncharacterized protein LOC116345823 n=1 Tax=Contarinia nasturtii TaxID=265458 RepID=UPI0012D40ACA|nr:uncharacterized protein LOC116345823 [Contarinia nasturtii]